MMGSYGSGMCNPAPTSRRSLTNASCLQWPGAPTVHTWPVATLMAVYRSGNSRPHSQPPACRRSPGIATGCRDWPLPPTAADWPARVGIGRSDSGTWKVGAVSTRLRGIPSGCNAWRGARMDARWPAPARDWSRLESKWATAGERWMGQCASALGPGHGSLYADPSGSRLLRHAIRGCGVESRWAPAGQWHLSAWGAGLGDDRPEPPLGRACWSDLCPSRGVEPGWQPPGKLWG